MPVKKGQKGRGAPTVRPPIVMVIMPHARKGAQSGAGFIDGLGRVAMKTLPALGRAVFDEFTGRGHPQSGKGFKLSGAGKATRAPHTGRPIAR